MNLTTGHVRRKTTGVSAKGLVAVIVWGASFVATRVALETLNPFSLVALRLWTGGLLLALVLRARGGPLLPQRRDRPACLFLAAVLSAHLLIQAYGLRYTSAIHTGWIIGFIPVTLALGAHLLGQQRIGRTGWTGVALGTAGIAIVWLSSSPDFAHAPFGDFLQFASCLTWTLYTLAATGPNARNGVLRVTTCGMLIAAALTTTATLWSGVLTGSVTAQGLLAVAFLGLVCSGVAYYLWFAAVEEHGPARVGSLLYVEPFVALATGAVLLNEHVTLHAISGGLCVLLGVWLVARGSRR